MALGRGALPVALKSDREGVVECMGSENAGMSNEKRGENPVRRKPKVS